VKRGNDVASSLSQKSYVLRRKGSTIGENEMTVQDLTRKGCLRERIKTPRKKEMNGAKEVSVLWGEKDVVNFP